MAISIEWIGGLAGTLTTVSFVPQVLKVIRDRDTAAISLRMYCAFTLGVALWLAYGICLHSASIVWSNSITLILAGSVLSLKLYLD